MRQIALSCLCLLQVFWCDVLVAGQPLTSEMEVVRKLYLDSNLRDRADVSPGQQVLLKQLLDDTDLKRKIRQVVQLRDESDIEKRFRIAESQFDAEVRVRALKILTAEQLKTAKNDLILSKYGTPALIFRDKRYLEQLDVLSIPAELEKALDEAEDKFASEVRNAQVEMARKLFREFPESQRQKIVDLFGNELFPAMEAQNNEMDSIPFDPVSKTSAPIRQIVRRKDLQLAISVTDSQLEQLEEIQSVLSAGMSEAGKLRQVSDMKRQLTENDQHADERYTRTLTDKQRIAVCRFLTLQKIFFEPVGFFDRKDVASYFGFSLDEQIRICALVQTLNTERLASLNKSRYESLVRFCDLLGHPAKSIILTDFDGVWNP